jgi:glutamine---fructose-6-phosphate transaminase (isomerizing)
MNSLRADILAQGINTTNVLNHLLGPERERLTAAARFIDPHKPILLIGVASADYLCWPAQVYLSQAGYVTRTMNAADALYHEWPALRRANVVINSRSGETAEIVKLGERLEAASIPFLAVTNEPQSTLAQMTDHILWANTRRDTLVSINVVTGMMLTTLVWAAAVKGELDQVRPDLEDLPAAVELTVEHALCLADQVADCLSACKPIYLLARGASQGAALCGRLVLEEVARQPAVALEAAEFRQGPNEVIDEEFGALVFIGRGETSVLTRSLAREIHRYGGTAIAVGTESDIRGLPGMLFPLPVVPEAFSPLLEVIPVQGLAYTLAARQGFEPGTVRYITKIIMAEVAE